MLLIAPGALALTSGTAEVSGNPDLSLSLTVTGAAYAFGSAMLIGDNVNLTADTVKVGVVSNAPWAVGVHDAEVRTTTAGHMAEWDGTAYVGTTGKTLTNALQIGKKTDGGTYVTLTDASLPLWSGVAGTVDNYPWFKQTIDVADTRVANGHTYKVVTTFTATPT
ncbi:MAG: hypothetical protein LUQ66_08150 [Methanoregula sp.]|nr:hypothetical protein [Methanoregula sp.]